MSQNRHHNRPNHGNNHNNRPVQQEPKSITEVLAVKPEETITEVEVVEENIEKDVPMEKNESPSIDKILPNPSVAAIRKAVEQSNSTLPPQPKKPEVVQPPQASKPKPQIEVAEDVEIVVDDSSIIEIDDDGEFKSKSIEIDDEELENAEIELETTEDETRDDSQNYIRLKLGSYKGNTKIKSLANISYNEKTKVETKKRYQDLVIEQFISSKSSGFTGSRSVTRVALPYSGFHMKLLSLTNGEYQNLYRATADLPFLDKWAYELQVFYDHMQSNSIKPDLTFEEWLAAIKLPDWPGVYWANYNNYAPGINEYESHCDKCRAPMVDKRDNYEITFLTDSSKEDITQNDIDAIYNGVPKEDVNSYKKGAIIIEKKGELPDSRIKVYYGIPNLLEVLTFLQVLRTEEGVDEDLIKRIVYPVHQMRFDRYSISRADYIYTMACKCRMYVRKLLAPVTEKKEPEPGEDPTNVKYKVTYVDVQPEFIGPILSNLSKKDTVELCKGVEMWKMIGKTGYRFTVRDSVCPACGAKQLPLELDMREQVFKKAAQDLDFLAGI